MGSYRLTYSERRQHWLGLGRPLLLMPQWWGLEKCLEDVLARRPEGKQGAWWGLL